jgi:hypothetical protein
MRSVLSLCAFSALSPAHRVDSYRAFRSTAEPQGSRRLRRHLELTRYSFLITLLLLCGLSAKAQRPGERPVRDVVQELSRIDTNRAVDLQKIKANSPNEVRQAIQKQITNDFKELQSLNNKMMATAWEQPTLDYKYISRMTGEIAKKATRLRSNLALPKSEEKEAVQPSEEISTKEAFKAELLSLDRSVMSFVTNPIFQKTNVMDLRLANQATSDLEAVISRSNKLKRVSAKLGKH